MKTLAIGILAAATVGAALPAAAQPRFGDWQPLAQRQDNIERRIDRGVQRGDLTRAEARGLHQEYRQLLRLEDMYRRDGFLDGRERVDLQRRYDMLSQQIRFERRDRDTRYYPAGRR